MPPIDHIALDSIKENIHEKKHHSKAIRTNDGLRNC